MTRSRRSGTSPKRLDWGYVKNQGQILGIVDAGSGWIEVFPAANRTSETVEVYLSQIFARFGITKKLVSNNGREFVSVDIKQWCESLEIKKIESCVILSIPAKGTDDISQHFKD